MLNSALDNKQDLPFGLKGSYHSQAQLTLNHLHYLSTKPSETCVFHKQKWDKLANVLEVEPNLEAELTLSEVHRPAVADLLKRLKCTERLGVNLSMDVNLTFFNDACPKSCLPGYLTLCSSTEGIQVSYPEATLIMPSFSVFTSAGLKKHESLHHPMMELLCMINQLFSVSYITEPTMLYKLVAISLGIDVLTLA